MNRYLIPLGIFIALTVLLYIGLGLNPREVPSPLIGKPAPAFELASVADPGRTLASTELRGQVYLLNVWASWCVSCRQEHPLLMRLARSGTVPIYGLNYKDQRGDAQRWLAQFGDPYAESLFDTDGRVGMDYGVYGTPETFVIDKQGMIRHKKIGPVTEADLNDTILPLVKKLQAES
jgi:cytochrome c biogenesis protein CcmG, thiol:disulfide interchange protein DsbE